MPKLNRKELDYYKGSIKEDMQEHQKAMDIIEPEKVRALYEGYLVNTRGDDEQVIGQTSENYLFISVNTIVPGLYYQVPKPNIRSNPGGSPYSAEVLNGLVRNYFDEKAKRENQVAILDAFMMYGFGCVKIGYNSRTVKVDNKVNPFTGKTGSTKDPKAIESGEEYLKYEGAYVERVSPKDVFMDSTKDFGKGRKITFRYDRTLKELMDSNLYSLGSDFVSYFMGRKSDPREIKLKVYEHWCFVDQGVWKLVYTEDWQDEMYWGKTPYPWLPCSLLRFNDVSDKLYTTSHGCLAGKAQKELNYLNELWKTHVDKIRRLHLVDTTGLTEAGKKAIKAGDIDAIVECTRNPQGIYQQISSNPMAKDAYANIQNVRAYLQQLLSTTGALGGSADQADTLGQEKLLQSGNVLRVNGMQDKIRDFNIDQIKKMIHCIVEFGNPELTVKITGKNIKDPVTGEIITGKSLQLGGENGLNLVEEIEGNWEEDYKYNVDMTSASRPDFAVIRKQLADAIALAGNMQPLLQQEGMKVNFGELMKDYFNTFETLPDPSKYVEDMDEAQKREYEMMQALKQFGGQMGIGGSGQGVPTEEAIGQGAEAVPTGISGLGGLE